MSTDDTSLVPTDPHDDIVRASGVDALLESIRPEWQAKSLIQRVRKILRIDPSSACQRLLNAAIHDLREKIVRAGLDIAKEAANRFGLPAIQQPEDILENYSVTRIIDLSYRMGLLSRPDWRRLKRAYEIRRDLEHEDDEYEAAMEDLVYIFKTSIDIVLSREPVDLLKLSDVKDLISAPQRAVPSLEFVHEYEVAPEPRQREILDLLIKTALDSGQADLIRQNAVELMRAFDPITKGAVKIDAAKAFQARIATKRLELAVAKVANAAGLLAYLKQRQVGELYDYLYSKLDQTGYDWRKYALHDSILNDIEDVGGLDYCPAEQRRKLVLWMTLCYLGEPGGYGAMGGNRKVFYSDFAAPKIERMFSSAAKKIKADVQVALADPRAVAACANKFISRRADALLDLVSGEI